MDSSNVDCARFASVIRSKKDRILDIWRKEVREFVGQEIKQSLLDNKMTGLLEVVAAALDGNVPSIQAAQEETVRSVQHGLERAEQGFEISQVIREFHVLRRAIRATCAEVGMPLTAEANDITSEVLDAAAAIGVSRCAQKREDVIEEKNAQKLSFAVHDFRTPLGAVALAAAEIAEAIPPESRIADVMEPLASLERNIERLSVEMEKTMREFANVFSGMEEIRIQQVAVYPLVADLVDELEPQARIKNLTLFNEVAPDIEVAAAPGSLRRVLVNLIGNALRHTRIGGVTVSSLEKETETDIVVRDTGLGIVAEKLASVFEPGTREQTSPGMGFGLAIAKYLVELQRGRISIESTIGKGTAVTVTVPKAKEH